MPKRYREDADAAARLRFHLAEIQKLMVMDTARFKDDQHDLLKDCLLLVRDEEASDDADDDSDEIEVNGDHKLSVTEFLKSELPERRRHIINKLRTPFSRTLIKEKRRELKCQNKRSIVHTNVNKPSMTYFERDRPLMLQVLRGMDTTVDACILKIIAEARQILSDLDPEEGVAP